MRDSTLVDGRARRGRTGEKIPRSRPFPSLSRRSLWFASIELAVATSPAVTVADAGAATGPASGRPLEKRCIFHRTARWVPSDGDLRWLTARICIRSVKVGSSSGLRGAMSSCLKVRKVWLYIMPATATDLASLSALAPDAIQALRLYVAKLDVSELHAIARLADLRRLQLGLLDEHLAELGVLPRLEQLNLSPTERG